LRRAIVSTICASPADGGAPPAIVEMDGEQSGDPALPLRARPLRRLARRLQSQSA
jgi:hypothetical protein